MWIFLGVAAIITAVLNIITWSNGKEAKYFRFISLSLTAMTVCAFYSAEAKRVELQQWGALMDYMPSVATYLWYCVVASIVINAVSLLKNRSK